MSRLIRRFRPTPSMAVALLALVVAMGGTSYAAVTLAANSVGNKQIRYHAVSGSKLGTHAVTLSKIKTHAVSQSRIAPGAVSPSKLSKTVQAQLAGKTGPTGATGPQGPAGAKGTALAYGAFAADGGAQTGTTFNLAGLQGNHAATGVHCYSGLAVALTNVVATPDAATATAGATVAATLHDAPGCPAGTQIEVDTFRPAAGGVERADEPFYLQLN